MRSSSSIPLGSLRKAAGCNPAELAAGAAMELCLRRIIDVSRPFA
ncbi:hypothetical protein [Microbacterium sp. LWH3-1.2]